MHFPRASRGRSAWRVTRFLFNFRTSSATPAPVEKLERNGKETEKEDEKEDGEAAADKERAKEKERDEGREVENNRTADSEEVSRSCQ